MKNLISIRCSGDGETVASKVTVDVSIDHEEFARIARSHGYERVAPWEIVIDRDDVREVIRHVVHGGLTAPCRSATKRILEKLRQKRGH